MTERYRVLPLLQKDLDKTNRGLNKIPLIVAVLDQRMANLDSADPESYIEWLARTGRVKEALLTRAQPPLGK